MKKKYITRSLSFLITIKVDGKIKNIKFEKISSNFKGMSYITGDEKIQEALEATTAFGHSFTIDKKYNPEPEPETEGKANSNNKLESLPPFNTVNEAKDYFNKEHGVPVSKLMTRSAIISEAEKLGFEVQFINA